MSTRASRWDAINAVLDVYSPRMPGNTFSPLARDLDVALRSAVRAALPGRQQQKNLDPVMDLAHRAFVRALKRRGKRLA